MSSCILLRIGFSKPARSASHPVRYYILRPEYIIVVMYYFFLRILYFTGGTGGRVRVVSVRALYETVVCRRPATDPDGVDNFDGGGSRRVSAKTSGAAFLAFKITIYASPRDTYRPLRADAPTDISSPGSNPYSGGSTINRFVRYVRPARGIGKCMQFVGLFVQTAAEYKNQHCTIAGKTDNLSYGDSGNLFTNTSQKKKNNSRTT